MISSALGANKNAKDEGSQVRLLTIKKRPLIWNINLWPDSDMDMSLLVDNLFRTEFEIEKSSFEIMKPDIKNDEHITIYTHEGISWPCHEPRVAIIGMNGVKLIKSQHRNQSENTFIAMAKISF